MGTPNVTRINRLMEHYASHSSQKLVHLLYRRYRMKRERSSVGLRTSIGVIALLVRIVSAGDVYRVMDSEKRVGLQASNGVIALLSLQCVYRVMASRC